MGSIQRNSQVWTGILVAASLFSYMAATNNAAPYSSESQLRYAAQLTTIQQDTSNSRFSVPFLVLMSNQELSVVQMPLIENGSVTAVYSMPQHIPQLYNAARSHETEEDVSSARDTISQSKDASSSSQQTPITKATTTMVAASNNINNNNNDSMATTTMGDADARAQHEQMQRGPNTSLGKSEWQQIANEAAAALEEGSRKKQEEGSISATAAAVVAGRDASDKHERRRREAMPSFAERSNSFLASAHRQQQRRSRAAMQTREEAEALALNSGDAQASSGEKVVVGANVTSAQFETTAAHTKQPADDSRSPAEASVVVDSSVSSTNSNSSSSSNDAAVAAGDDDDGGGGGEDDIANSRDGDGDGDGDGAAVNDDMPHPERSSGGGHNAQRERNDAPAEFTDFDVHMAMGYAFVADSYGRVHRIKLLSSDGAPHRPLYDELLDADDDANNIDETSGVRGPLATLGSSGSADKSVQQQQPQLDNRSRAANNDASAPTASDNDDANKLVGAALNVPSGVSDVTHDRATSGRHPTSDAAKRANGDPTRTTPTSDVSAHKVSTLS